MALLCIAARGAVAAPTLGPCVGDCNGNGEVAVNELVIGINIALELRPIGDCTAFNVQEDLRVTINELVLGVRALLDGCSGPVPSVTPTPSITPSVYPGPSATNTARPTQPPSLVASFDGPVIRLAWPTPDPSTGLIRSRLLRKLNSPPLGPEDEEATEIVDMPTDLALDDVTQLLPDTSDRPNGTLRVYYYSVYPCTGPGVCDANAGMTAQLRLTLMQVLSQGGYTIYWRHTSASVCADRLDLGTAAETTVPDWWKSCDANCPPAGTATARQLNDMGRAQATTIGEAIRGRFLPFGRVLSSEYCRARQTAELMSLGPPIEEDQGITYFVYDEVNRCTHALAALSQPPEPGTNTAIVGHAGFSCPPVLDTLEMGEAAIYRPDGDGGADYIARLLPNEWATFGTPTPSPSATPTLHPSITPTNTATPIAITAGIANGEVRLEWPTPDPASGYTHSLVLRRLNEPPAWTHDPEAVSVFDGTAGSVADEVTELLPNAPSAGGVARTYYYRVFACRQDGSCEETGGTTTFTLSLTDALRGGGYTVYFRHGEATVCNDCVILGPAATTTLPNWWKSCDTMCPSGGCESAGMATARQLSATGVQQSETIGEGISDHEIPFARVVSSEYCRAVQTAEHMNLGPTIETDQGITLFVYDEANRCTHAYEEIGEEPEAGSNTAIVAHGGFLPECERLSELQMGDAAVFKPDGNGGAEFVGRLRPNDWGALP